MRHSFNRCCSTAALFLLLLLPFAAAAQCPNDNSLVFAAPTNLTPSGVGNTVTNTQMWGGEYATVNVQSGANYTISTCVGNSYNTILSLYNQGTGTLAAFNDDFCGLQSQISYTATFTGVLRVLIDQQPGCASNGTNSTVSVTLNSLPCAAPGIASDPANATVCPSGLATFSATTSASPDSVRWFRSTDGGSTWLRIANGAPYSGATTTTLTVNPATGAMSGTRYRLTVYKCAGPLSANSAAAILTAVDAIAPTATCRNISRNLSGTTASIAPTDINNGSTDNCGTVNLVSVSPNSFTCANIGSNTVTLTINDGNGNTSTCTGTVTIVDNTIPSATCRNITKPLIGNSVSITPSEINFGSTDNCGTVNLVSVTPSSFTCANLGTNSVTLAINDGRGNNATCTGFVTVTDTTRPSITCPSNVTTSTNPTSCVATGVSLGSAGATDNCTGSPTISNNGLASYPVGVTNVTWTATDGSSNSRTCVQTVTVSDLINPTAVCQNRTVNLSGSGTATVTGAQINNGSSDNCAISSLAVAPNTFTCANIGANPVTLTVTDNSGRTATCNATVTIADVTAPAATCQAAFTVNLNAGGTASILVSQINNGTTDNCSVNSTTLNKSTFNCTNLGANTITLTATDPSGNSGTCSTVVTIADVTAPSAVCQNRTVLLNGAGTATVTATQVNNGSTDNCSIASTTLSKTTFNCSNVGSNTVTLTVTDPSGNSGTCTATVTVQETTPPSAVCRPSVNVFLNGSGLVTPTFALIDNGSDDNCAITSTTFSPSSFDCSMTGTQSITMTVSDAAGNTASCISSINVQDTTSPAAICRNVTLPLSAGGSATLTTAMVDNGSSDNCGSGGLSVTQTNFTCAQLGANTVTLSVDDLFGNNSTCNATVTIVDNLAPSAVCQNLNLHLNAAGSATLTTAMVNNGSSDNCGITALSLSQTSFTCANRGANAVTLTAVDASTNSGTCTATVTVIDSIRPTGICQNASLVLNGSGTATLTPTMVNNGSSDNCGITSTTLSQTAFTCANVGTNTVTLTLADASGNSRTCSASVTVIDNTAPNAICQPRTLALNASGTATLTPTMVNNGSTDNCAIASTTLSQTAFTCANIGTTTVTLTATDASGNAGTCTATITVQDNTAPNAVCQPRTLTLNASGTASLTATMVNNGSTDNCSIASTTVSQTSFTCANAGTNTVTLTVTDGSGNAGTCTATITVVDNTAPSAVCQNVSLNLNASGTATLTPTMVNNGSTDNCAIASTTLSQTAFTCANIGANTVTLTATDASGNAGTCTATITVSDITAPNAICQPRTLALNASGTVTLTPTMVNNGSTDNCAIASTTLSQTAFTCANIGTTTVTLTATDASGNAGTCTATITVQDNNAPNAVCQPVTLTLNASGTASLTATMVNSGSTDNCSIASTTVSQTGFTCANTGANTVTLTVTDGSGNAGTCTATVTVIDNSAPNALCQNVTLTLDATGNANITPTMVNSGSTDNCAISTYSLSQNTFGCAQVGTNTVTMTTVDPSGNTSSCTATVTVIDNNAPNAVCGSVNAALDSTGIYTLDFTAIDGGSTDNCAIDSILLSQTIFTCADTGQNTVLVTLMDPSGNTSTCVATVVLPLNPVIVSLNAPLFNCGFHISCAGDSTGSIQPSVSGGCSPYTYAWSNGSTGSNLNGLPAGTYTVSVTDAIGRTDIQSFTLTEPAALSAAISGSTYACLGDPSASLDLSPLGGNNCQAYSYLWSDGDTTEDRSGLLAGTYSVTVTDASGCSTTQTATITTAPLPDPGVTASVQKCVEDSITLSAATNFVSYLWSNGQTNSSTTVLQAGTYTVQVTDSLGCVGGDTVNVVNRPSPSNFATVQGATIICIGDTTALVGDPGYASYTWSTGATTASLLVSGAGGNFILTVTDQFGCEGRDTATVTFHNVNVPNPVITPNPTAHMCQGGSVDLDAGGGYAVYTWSNAASTQIVSISSPGVYNVTVANGFGCTKASDSVTVIQVPNPTPTINYTNDTLHVSGSFVAFQWLINSVPIPGAILPYYVPTIDGNYSVQVTDINGCQGVSAPISVVVTGLRDELATAFGLGIYPNPTRDHLFLQASRVLNGTLDLRVTDLNGRLLYATQRPGLNGSTRIDLPAMASGMYLLQVHHAQKGSATFKFVVE